MAEQSGEPHAGVAEESSTHAWSQPRVFPLNSSRLTLCWLQAIAGGLGLPTNIAQEELRQMIDGHLSSQDREPMNVQVFLFSSEMGDDVQRIKLSDAQGHFLEVPVEPKSSKKLESQDCKTETQSDSEDYESEEERDSLVKETYLDPKGLELEGALQEAEQQVRSLEAEMQLEREEKLALQMSLEGEQAAVMALKEEVRGLNDSLRLERERVKHIWSLSCEQLRLLDEECGRCVRECDDKNREIELLRSRVRELEGMPRPVTRIADVPYMPQSGTHGVMVTAATGAPIRAPIPTPVVLPASRAAPESSSTPVGRRISFTHAQTETTPTTSTPTMRAQVNDSSVMVDAGTCTNSPRSASSSAPVRRPGKAPPVDSFTGEKQEVRFEDWLPTLERAATWNGWSSDEKLMQLAGHLRGKALQEWNLMSQSEKATYQAATTELTRRLDPGSRVMAVQDFRHTIQREAETVADYLRRLERHFQLAYGRDDLRPETRETMLYSQLQEGLLLSLVRSPSVSGCQTYKELCVAAKQEEKRLTDLRRRQLYQQNPKGNTPKPPESRRKPQSHDRDKSQRDPRSPDDQRRPVKSRACHNCGSTDHFVKDCKAPSKESSGNTYAHKNTRSNSNSDGGSKKKISVVSTEPAESTVRDDPASYMHSSSESDGEAQVALVRVPYEGSDPRRAFVEVQGIPAHGVVDTGADITIIGPELFKTIAAATRMKKRCLKPVDKAAFTYDHRPIQLDGKLELDIAFEGKAIQTPVYIKMDSSYQLLLSEGVCRQLGIITYHPSVRMKKPSTGETPPVGVPMVRVKLVKSISVPPLHCVTAHAKMDERNFDGPVLVESIHSLCEQDVQLADAVVSPVDKEGTLCVVLRNPTGFTQHVEEGTQIGQACEAKPVEEGEVDAPVVDVPENVCVPGRKAMVSVIVDDKERKKKLASLLVDEGQALRWQDRDRLYTVLMDHHMAFALDKCERGETDMVQMEILTGDTPPKRQPVRRTPFAVRGEIARQLREMQDNDVISPSAGPWASPVVLVRKKDGTLRFCIDYRELNSVTKADTFPLPRIDDLLDQLNKAKYFSTLDLAAGYWQVRVHPQSREKTAFITPQGLFQFNVMPFGLRNAPAVFQRLMQRVLAGLNPDEGVPFTSVYIDDILIFSETFEDHLSHLKAVIERIASAGLKLKPCKCKFIRQTVDFLGHILTPVGIHPNPDRVSAVQKFPRPQSVREVRQFLGLASYYRRFVKGFAATAQPLHSLTKVNSRFSWSTDCQEAFDTLKSKLLMAPVLSFPDFSRDFILETDASVKGLGAVLSQRGEDDKVHPVAYASRALSPQEQRYSVTELETLAVVWAIKHYLAYLYGNSVVVYTDHSAVRAVLNSPHLNGKHARWWSQVHGSGIKNLEIKYRAGRENSNADALSRNPVIGSTAVSEMVTEVPVATVEALECDKLLGKDPITDSVSLSELTLKQAADSECKPLLDFLLHQKLPEHPALAKKVAAQAPLFDVIDGILCFVGPKSNGRGRRVVPKQLRKALVEGYHGSTMSGHFSGPKLVKALSRHWWWQGMHRDVSEHCNSCPECTVVNASGRVHQPLLQPIPVQRAFQIVGVDVMELPLTRKGNKYVAVFQDFLTKWPFVFPMPDQKAVRLVKLLVEQVIPIVGVPESLLSDRGTNLLSHLMGDVCKLLGVKKLNTTSYHPACDGLVERFNRTLKLPYASMQLLVEINGISICLV